MLRVPRDSLPWQLRPREQVVVPVRGAADVDRPVAATPGFGEKGPEMLPAGVSEEGVLPPIACGGFVGESSRVFETKMCGHAGARTPSLARGEADLAVSLP